MANALGRLEMFYAIPCYGFKSCYPISDGFSTFRTPWFMGRCEVIPPKMLKQYQKPFRRPGKRGSGTLYCSADSLTVEAGLSLAKSEATTG